MFTFTRAKSIWVSWLEKYKKVNIRIQCSKFKCKFNILKLKCENDINWGNCKYKHFIWNLESLYWKGSKWTIWNIQDSNILNAKIETSSNVQVVIWIVPNGRNFEERFKNHDFSNN